MIRSATIGVVAFVLAVTMSSPAHAASPTATPSIKSSTSVVAAARAAGEDHITRVEVTFDHPITVSDAVAVAKPAGDIPVAYRYEGSGIVGEWSPGGQSITDFLATFHRVYGTEPQIVGYLVERQLPSVRQAAEAGTLPLRTAAVSTGKPTFQAAPVPEANARRLEASGSAGPTASAVAPDASAAAAKSKKWFATGGRFELTRTGKSELIYVNTNFPSGAHASVPAGFGMEIGVDLYNSNTGTRGGLPACGPGFRDQFIAKNYDWNSWSAFVEGADVGASRPYADYNDLLDSCGRNAMTIGFQYANKIPGTRIQTLIDAPIGTKSSSQLGASISLVDNNACTPIETNGVGGATDCMGILERTPAGMESAEIMLGVKKTSATPDACWTTALDSSGVTHATIHDPRSDACAV